ncbi:MAG: hypothetical protein IPP82_08140 [Xanthomonadales bacterium]|nr:hypothetical protein [Xanthomonadales bacterium]
MSARAILHLCALVLPMIPVLIWLGAMGKQFNVAGLTATLLIAAPAVLAAQTAALLRWRALDKRARSKQSAWPTGLGMAVLTHFFFGIYLALAFVATTGLQEWRGDGAIWQVPLQAIFFGIVSLGLAGAVSLPVTAWLAQVISQRREKELALESR